MLFWSTFRDFMVFRNFLTASGIPNLHKFWAIVPKSHTSIILCWKTFGIEFGRNVSVFCLSVYVFLGFSWIWKFLNFSKKLYCKSCIYCRFSTIHIAIHFDRVLREMHWFSYVTKKVQRDLQMTVFTNFWISLLIISFSGSWIGVCFLPTSSVDRSDIRLQAER